MENTAELIKQHDDYVALEVLENSDPETQEAIRTNPEDLKSAQEASREFRKPSVEPIEEPVEEPIEEPIVETNPWDSWGWSKDDISKLELSGRIKDGKYLGRFSPEQQRDYIKYTQDEEFKRGQLGKELGEARKELEVVKETKEFNKTFYESKAFRNSLEDVKTSVEKAFAEKKDNIFFDTDLTTLGADPNSAPVLQTQMQENAWNRTRDRLKRDFKRNKVEFPADMDALQELYAEDRILYEKVNTTLDDMFRDEVFKQASQQQLEAHRDDLITLSINDSWNVAKNDLQDWEIDPNETNPKIAALLRSGAEFFDKELQRARSRGEEPDQAYFGYSPDIGYVVRPEAFRNFIFNQHKDIIADPKAYFQEPVKDTPVNDDDAVSAVATSLENAHKYLTQEGIAIEPESPEFLEAFKYMQSKPQDPDFWVGGLMRSDAFERYLKLVRPDLIRSYLESQIVGNAHAKLQENTRLAQEALLTAKSKGDSAMKMASSEQGISKTGTIQPIPSPEIWNDPWELGEWRKEQGMTTEELQAKIVPRIKQHPNRHLYRIN